MYHIPKLYSRLMPGASSLPKHHLGNILQPANRLRTYLQIRKFHNTKLQRAVQPYLLADIGEGITECQIISWSVKPGDRVEQFDPICEVQSDKASVEITSRYEGIITKLHYDVDAMAKVGAPLLDIDIDTNEEATPSAHDEAAAAVNADTEHVTESPEPSITPEAPRENEVTPAESSSSNAGLVVPSVRRLLKEIGIDVSEVKGTGKAGRVLKEDVQRHAAAMKAREESTLVPSAVTPLSQEPTTNTTVPLNPIQLAMVQSMTQSLAIPHFLFTQIVNLTKLTALRKHLKDNESLSAQLTPQGETKPKLSALPFILKSVSEAIKRVPIVNSSIDLQSSSKQPSLIMKAAHNIGVAMDTPKGLLVPVIRNVQDHSIISLSKELQRLGNLAKAGKLAPSDMSGATIVVSNIGSIGGHVVAPVIMSPTVMILGVGKSREVPAFVKDADGKEHIGKQEEVVLSWSADHRILDGATVGRYAQVVASYIENVEALGMGLK